MNTFGSLTSSNTAAAWKIINSLLSVALRDGSGRIHTDLTICGAKKDSDEMSDQQPRGAAADVIAALDELIDALDRRVPHIERSGEIQIATDAARLRSEALARINQLRKAGSNHDSNLVDAIMTDDGGPARTE